MKNTCLTLLLLSCLTVTVYAGEQAPELLIHAAQCLSAKQHLPPTKATSLNLGYLVDEKSYPGEKVLYLLDYSGPSHSSGYVFSIFLTQQGSSEIFDIQNNARFVTKKEGIDFVEPPLGGSWTQEHLASAIEQIKQQPSFTVPVKDLRSSSSLVRCVSYTDNK
jgi:hypothetical protein